MGITHQHITPQELYGLKAIVMFIHALPVTGKSVPSLIQNAVELIKDVRNIVETHKDDSPEKCVTGKPLLDLVIVVGHCQDRDVCQDPVISPSHP